MRLPDMIKAPYKPQGRRRDHIFQRHEKVPQRSYCIK